MRRRRLLKAMAAAPAAPALLAQQPQANAPGAAGAPGAQETPRLETAVPDAAAVTVPRFFTPPQLAALRKLSELIMPPMNGSPGALEAGAPEFLDFLIGQSPTPRQQLYRAGLDSLNAQAKKRFQKTFAEVDASQAGVLLAPLREPFSPEPPSDPLAKFLMEAKRDIRTATVNSREYSAAVQDGGGRRFGSGGLYWRPLD
jgi:hypothetical protein